MRKEKIIEKDKIMLEHYGIKNMDLSHAMRFKYDSGETIANSGDAINYLYFIIKGKVKVFVNLSSGKQLSLAYFTSSGILGEIDLVSGVSTPYVTIMAVSDVICVALPLNMYGESLRRNIDFMNYLAGELARRLTQRSINGAITTLQPLESRLCAYITQTAINGVFHETLTEVSGMVGASYRHLLRCLQKLCEEQILSKQAHGYVIVNPQLLNDKAGDLYVQ